MMKGSIHQEDITFLNTDAPDRIILNYIKQKQMKLKGEIDKSTITVTDLSN